MAEAPIHIAVVGHTNAGKTSLLRTLTRRADFGQVSDRPGTTRHVETVGLRAAGVAVQFADTPGLEDPVALLELVQAIPHTQTPTERVRAFLRRPEASAEFEQEAKVLRALLDADAAFYVIDCREAVLPKHHSEIALLQACATPVMPVLNHLRSAQSHPGDWRAALAEHGLHVQAGFDAVAPLLGAEVQLLRDLATLLSARRAPLNALADQLARDQHDRHRAGLRCIASHLIGLAALRHTLERDEAADEAQRAQCLAAFRQQVATQAQQATEALLRSQGFQPGDAELAGLPGLAGRWEDELFNPAVLQDAAVKLGTGAAVGAAIGLGLDVALAGLSLGTATALGATLGGLASQGFGPAGRALANRLNGRQDLTLEDPVLGVLADRLLALLNGLAQRGHAATDALRAPEAGNAVASTTRHEMLGVLAAARGRPDWALGATRSAGSEARREALVAALLPPLSQAAAARPAA